MPKISVIIPVYNTEKYIKECLDSVICQTLSDIEIICIDDGSIDNSLQILSEYEKKDERIRVLKQKNRGAGSARNLGLKFAKGEYIAFLDSDDFFNFNFLEKMYNKAQKHDSDIVICSANSYNTEKQEYELMHWSLEQRFLPPKEVFNYEDIPDYIFNIGQNWNWNKIYRHNFIVENKIDFQKLYRTNDLLFTCKALILAKKISVINETLVNYRIAQEKNCQSTNHIYPFDFYKAFRQLRIFLLSSKKYEKVKKSYLAWAIDGCAYNINSIKNEKIAKKVIKKVFTKGLKELDLRNYQIVNPNTCYNFYEFETKLNNYKAQTNNFLQNIFSLRNSLDKKHKIITIFGVKLKIKRNGK